MNSYRVIASDPETALVALEDQDGRCHLGRALVPPPPSGAELRGESPAFGVCELRHADAGELCPLVIVALNCDPEAAVLVVKAKVTSADPAAGS